MQLHDIFPAIEVVEYSMYWLLLYLMMGVLILVLLWKYVKHHKQKGLPYYLNLLEGFDVTHAKYIAYRLEHYGKYIIKTETQTQNFQKLIKKLSPYKYVQDDITLPLALQKELTHFLETIRRENV